MVRKIAEEIRVRLSEKHEKCFNGCDYPVLLISTQYPGLWLEHLYDSVFYASFDKSKIYLAENAARLFIDNQKEDGQLPAMVINRATAEKEIFVGFGQIQECVSFASLCLKVYELNSDKVFLKKCFDASKKWVNWLKNNRMTKNAGLVEMFCGFDTGHDNSPRVNDLGVKGNYKIDGITQNAGIMPPADGIIPIFAVDMNCNFYGNLVALSKMAKILNEDEEDFLIQAQSVKKRLFEVCFDETDCFFYDADKDFNKRKIISSTIFHLFIEGVLDKDEDKEIIDEIFKKYILNEKHFYTEFPFPAVSISDPAWKKYTPFNCWGYFTQGLIVLRSTLWLEKYGYKDVLENVLKKWTEAWTENYGKIKLGQELDPITGEPSNSSEWYSSCMLTYLYTSEVIL